MTGIASRPVNLAVKKLCSFLPQMKYSITPRRRPGQNAILKCSQVLSLTAAITATGLQ